MLLGRRSHTVGDTIKYTVDYCHWLARGDTVASVTVTSDDEDFVISNAAEHDNKVVFFGSGGTVGTTVTVTVEATTSRDEIKRDTIKFNIVAQ